jgi:hypothetical protein
VARKQDGKTVLGVELRYLLETGRSFVNGQVSAPSPPETIDWDALRQQLVDHRLVATLTPLLERSAAPDRFTQPLGLIRHGLLAHNQALLFELLRVLPPIEATGSMPIVLGGPALAYSVYADQETRLLTDIELLVRRDRLDKTCQVLYQRGYQNAHASRHADYLEKRYSQRILLSPSGVRVEIQWDLARPAGYARYDLDAVWERCAMTEIEGQFARVPSLSDQLLLTAHRQLACGFTEFHGVLDAALLTRGGACEEPGVALEARRQGLATSLWVLLGLAWDLLESRFSTQLETAIQPPALVRGCLRSLSLTERALMFGARQPSDVQEWIYRLCRPSSRGKLSTGRIFAFQGRRLARHLLQQKPHRPA